MKRILKLLILISVFSCSMEDSPSPDDPTGKNTSVLIAPNQIDSKYAITDENHYVVRNDKTHLNKLLLFIGGSYSAPKEYKIFCDHAATIGLDVISLSYPNDVATAPLGTSSDQYIFDKYRDELCLGNQVSDAVSVDVLNSITTRTTKLLAFLKTIYPDENWGQYLTPSNTPQWNKIIVAGHSQGSGHACFLGKQYLVDRVIMLSGPNDYSTYFSKPANWLTKDGQTPLTKHFSLLHTQDQLVPFAQQVANLKGLGLLTGNQNPTLADDLSPPYSNAHSLSISIPALSFHNSTVGAHSILPDIWTYMLTTP